jgi:hypothetical protein
MLPTAPSGGFTVRKASYPKEQMHRIRYTKLTPQQIGEKLAAAAAGPKSASEYSDTLAGKSLRIVTDNGPTLSYAFGGKNRLTVTEGSGSAVESGYGALTLKQATLFSHLVPGTQKGYHVVIDQATNLATVFEVWFSGYRDNREVQRQIYFGYVEEDAKQAPTRRHGITNRVEGKGFHWVQDSGIETLEFYPSVLSSSFVDLTRFGGELTFCGPSDFIKVDDNLYVYARVECEFSGTMTLYVLDLLSVRQVGVRLGFDEQDALEYYMFNGTGEITGQLATFERFGDHGEKIVMGNRPPTTGKGERPVYRPLLTNPPMTEAEVHAAVTKHTELFRTSNPMAGNKMPESGALVGKELTLRFDNGGPVWNYRFDSPEKLRWRRAGEKTWHEEAYRAFEPDEDVLMFSHIHTGSRPNESVAIVVDLANALATCVHGKLGTEYMGNEVSQKIFFGIVEMEGLVAPRYKRHQHTDELVGHAVTWNYSGGLTSMHVYSSPHSSSWTIFLESGAGGLQWSSPCQYVKLRDDLYLFSWVEEACNGHQGTIVYNRRTMHDCGFGYGVGKDGLHLNAIGAHARNAGYFDVKKYYGPKLT